MDLHPDTLETLIHLWNKIWLSGWHPKYWREAIIIAFLNEGSYPSSRASYSPITLASCLCKRLGKTINERPVYFLEYRGLLESCQGGFRAGRSINDELFALEPYIKDANIHNHYCIMAFFEIEKLCHGLGQRHARRHKNFWLSGNMSNTLWKEHFASKLVKPFPGSTCKKTACLKKPFCSLRCLQSKRTCKGTSSINFLFDVGRRRRNFF